MKFKNFAIQSVIAFTTIFVVLFATLANDVYAGCGGCNYSTCSCVINGRFPASQTDSCWYDEATKNGCDGHNWKYLSDNLVCETEGCFFRYNSDHDGYHCRVEHCNICGAYRYDRHICGSASGSTVPAIPAPVYYTFNLYANNNQYISSSLVGTVDNGTMAADKKSVSYTRQEGHAVPKTVPVPSPVKLGWHFKGYFSAPDEYPEGVLFVNETSGFPLQYDRNAYAHYERNKYTVAYNGNYPAGKAVDSPQNITCTYYYDKDYSGDRTKIDYSKGISKTIGINRDLIGDPVYGVHGYVWNGWWTSPNDGEGVRVTTWEQLRDLQSDALLARTDNPTITIYAHWSKSDGDVYLHDEGSYVFNTALGTTSTKKPYATVDYLDSIYAPVMPLKAYYVYFDGNGGTPSASSLCDKGCVPLSHMLTLCKLFAFLLTWWLQPGV